jgi:hypothetical protein
MKKFYFFTLVLMSVTVLQAQIPLTQSTHGIVPGNAFAFVFTQPVEEGVSGKNIIWDFSSLKSNGKTLTSNMLNAIETTKGGEVSKANVAIEEFGNQFYFADSKNGILDYGVAMSNSLIKYDAPAVKLPFPLSYGKKVSGNFSGTQITGTQTTPITGTYEVYADAYGKLILPDGVILNNTLRVKQTRTYGSCACKEIVYRWYIKDLHYPVLVITKYADANGKETASQTAYHPYSENKTKGAIAAQEEESEVLSSIKTYPNPWKESLAIEISFASEANVQIELFDNYGKLVKVLQPKQKQAAGKYSYQLGSNYPAGVYFLHIINDSENLVKKLVKE